MNVLHGFTRIFLVIRVAGDGVGISGRVVVRVAVMRDVITVSSCVCCEHFDESDEDPIECDYLMFEGGQRCDVVIRK